MPCTMQALLQQYIAKYGSGQPVSIFSHLSVQQTLSLQAVGVPGNGVCELGELLTPTNAGAAHENSLMYRVDKDMPA